MSLSLDEFRCSHCGKLVLDSIFFAKLSRARVIADVPFIINSGYRCEAYNKAEGSTSQNHVQGKAADIKATDGLTRSRILTGLYGAGFKRVGIRKDFIHADTMEEVESCWLY